MGESKEDEEKPKAEHRLIAEGSPANEAVRPPEHAIDAQAVRSPEQPSEPERSTSDGALTAAQEGVRPPDHTNLNTETNADQRALIEEGVRPPLDHADSAAEGRADQRDWIEEGVRPPPPSAYHYDRSDDPGLEAQAHDADAAQATARESRGEAASQSHFQGDKLSEAEERKAVERVVPLLTDTPQDYLRSLDEPGDHRHHQFAADKCDILADTLDRHAGRLERIGVTEQPRNQFYGQVGEIISLLPYERMTEARNLNNPDVGHDNHFGSDVAIHRHDGSLAYEADSKVSTQDYPFSTYRKALQSDDAHIDAGRLSAEQAHLVIPEDHQARFSEYLRDNYPGDAERWLQRVHTSGLPPQDYRTMADLCSDERGIVQVESIRDLERDLRIASAYIRRRIDHH